MPTSRRSSNRRAPKRKLVWARDGYFGSTTVLTGASPVVWINPLASLETELGSQIFGATIYRIVGTIDLWLSATVALNDGDTAAFVWAIGVSESERNIADGDLIGSHQDWMAFGGGTLLGEDAAAGSTDATDGGGFVRVSVDTRARRKLDEVGSILQMAVERPAAGSATNANVSMRRGLSYLIALP